MNYLRKLFQSFFGAASRKYPYEEQDCPGHIEGVDDPKICDNCGTHIDSLRPPDDDE
jgi:hypothetical protein